MVVKVTLNGVNRTGTVINRWQEGGRYKYVVQMNSNGKKSPEMINFRHEELEKCDIQPKATPGNLKHDGASFGLGGRPRPGTPRTSPRASAYPMDAAGKAAAERAARPIKKGMRVSVNGVAG